MQTVYELHHPFFIFFILLTILPVAYAIEVELTLQIVEVGQTGFVNDEISLTENESLDLQNSVQTVPDVPKTIGSTEVILTQQVQLVSSTFANSIVLENTDLTTVSVSISDQTKISGPAKWDKKLIPPKTIASGGTVPSGFQTPTSSIQVGSSDVILVFDIPVTITLSGVTGQIAYKLPGENTWNLIDGCLGTYANPTNPTFPNECSINNEIDTKILTYHFTEFAGLDEKAPKKISEGKHRTGVGPGVSSAGERVKVLPEKEESKEEEIKEEPKEVKIPDWFRVVFSWWAEGKVTTEEVNTAWEYLLKVLK